ncbi:MAG: type VI secretion system Vgr family protein [Rhodothermales bacterium]
MLVKDVDITRFFFQAHKLAPETFKVVDFKGDEAVSQLSRFEINLVSTDPAVAFDQVINAPASLILMHGFEAVPIHGIVADFQHIGYNAHYYVYRAVLVPSLWRLSLNYQSRIFQHQTVEEIITQVLRDAGFMPGDYQFDLVEDYAEREYVVQYQETDLNFISRMMEAEGMFYFFEHEENKEVLVIRDHQGDLPLTEGESSLGYHPGEGMVGEKVVMRSFLCRERVVTGKVKLNDYNYRTPETSLLVESQINEDMPGVHYEYGQHYKDETQGERLARVRNQEIECRRRVMYGRSNSPGMRSGHSFSLTDHYLQVLNADYLVTHVRHYGQQHGAIEYVLDGKEKDKSEYFNDLTCLPVEVPYRAPRRTPVPRVPGIMTARMESRGGKYAYLDEEGRYRARMHFDLSDTPPTEASRPIRMNQPHSGPDYGIHFPNHADTEMVWACINGNPDRPMALGTVPNPSQASPATSENNDWNVIRTWSGNELSFIDTEGEELIMMAAEKDHSAVIRNNRFIHVGNSLDTYVEQDETRLIKEGSRDVILEKGNDTLLIEEGSLRIEVKSGDVQITSLNGGGTIKSKDATLESTASTLVKCGGSTIELTPSDILMMCGGSTISMTPGEIVITSPMVKINP